MVMRALRTWMAAVLALGALALGATATAQVPDPFARELAQKLTQAELSLAESGYMRAAGPFPGGFSARETRSFPLSLRAGQDYSIVAVCDGRCVLDLRLIDPNGVPLARGAGGEGGWAMRVRPRLTGSHTVEVEAVRCAAAQCWYAVNVYAR